MKKSAGWILIFLLLTGCSRQQTFETISDEVEQVKTPQMQHVCFDLPQSAAVPMIQGDSADRLYLCDEYTLAVQIQESGDLEQTIMAVTGFSRDKMSIVQTAAGEFARYDCVWTAAGEAEEQVGRLAIIDDGDYHYILTAMTDASKTKLVAQQWNEIFSSFSVSEEAPISTGS